jgi:hypothetical protein
MSQYTVIDVIDSALTKSGMKSKKIKKSHSYRKGFKTICEQSGMKSINVELLLGHSLGVSDSYYRPSESDVLTDFMHACEYIISSNNVISAKKNHDALVKIGKQTDIFYKKHGVSKYV